MKRRNERILKAAIVSARSEDAKAVAYYRLGLFHDNNGREARAIPYYLRALKLDLPRKLKPKVLAWLASSLYKTGHPARALLKIKQAKPLADKPLHDFLVRLERRIRRYI